MTAANPGIWRLMQASGRDRPASSARDFRRVVLRYAVSGVAALILLGAAGVYLLQHVARDEAIRNARENAELAGRGVVAPALTPALLRADPAAVARLDRVVRRGILGGRIVRVKIWDATGRVVYSDDHRLIGSRYRSGADELHAIAPGQTEAEVSDLSRPENRFERQYDKLLEVYLQIQGPHGAPLLFETYDRYSSVAASGRKLWLAFAPAILGTLALLWLPPPPPARRGARPLRGPPAPARGGGAAGTAPFARAPGAARAAAAERDRVLGARAAPNRPRPPRRCRAGSGRRVV